MRRFIAFVRANPERAVFLALAALVALGLVYVLLRDFSASSSGSADEQPDEGPDGGPVVDAAVAAVEG